MIPNPRPDADNGAEVAEQAPPRGCVPAWQEECVASGAVPGAKLWAASLLQSEGRALRLRSALAASLLQGEGWNLRLRSALWWLSLLPV